MREQPRLKERVRRRLRGERRAVRGGGRRKTDHEPNRGWVPALVVALTVAALDWFTKWLVAVTIPLGSMVEVIEGRLALWHVRNDAMILGLYGSLPVQSRKVIAVVAAAVGAVLLFEVVSRGHRLPPHRRRWAWIFVGLASGGMLGNLGERAVHWGVTDFISIGWGPLWLPPGNIADLALFSCIPVAAIVIYFELSARSLRGRRQPQGEVAVAGVEPGSDR